MHCIHKKYIYPVLRTEWIWTFQFPFQTLCADNCVYSIALWLDSVCAVYFGSGSHMPFTSIDWPIWCQIHFNPKTNLLFASSSTTDGQSVFLYLSLWFCLKWIADFVFSCRLPNCFRQAAEIGLYASHIFDLY